MFGFGSRLLQIGIRASPTRYAPSVKLRSRAFTSSAVCHKTVIVTGSARGIGKAIAIRLAHDGYDVCVNDIPANESLAKDVAKEVASIGRKSCTAIADVSDRSQVENMVKSSTKELGPLDTMIANAGIAQVKPLLDLTEEDFSRMLDINVKGVHNCYAAAAKQIIAQGNATNDNPAKILGAASIVSFKPFPLLSHYSASKWAVRGLTQAYAMEMAEHNITVNAYAPGIVGTQMWDLIDEEVGKQRGEKLGELIKKGETIKKYTKELIALGRTSVPEDVAKLVSFLSSRDSDYITGQTMVVDGGIIMT
ncbi:acetoin dehydrogenase-like protein [Myriangium duriaei CBS 260.36]|uniref:Acetoin dehydrogenase-like protein n=1 Tax=Myriangium duriaei CBS 260.36 TaxID=1168546 RepID=A0A9P4MNU5_9PEZI|nr:acetoin dehydrogenase-like protein [Myriangium duriaei CBS 260.36]